MGATVKVSLQLTTLVDSQSALVTTEILKHHENCVRQMHLVAKCNSQVQLSDAIFAAKQRNDREIDRHDKYLQKTAGELHIT